MAKTPYELWKETQEKEKKGQSTVPKAPYRPVQYSNPTYQGKSNTNKTYNWETENLKPMKSRKNVRSYNAKFDKWANDNGLTAGEAKEFRTWLDSKEDGVKTTADQMNGTLKTLQQRNQKVAEQIKNAPKVTKKQEPKKANETNNKQQRDSNWYIDAHKWVDKKVLQPVEGLATRFVTNAADGIGLNQVKKSMEGKDNPEFLEKALEKPDTKTEKVVDVAGQFAGMAAPIGAAYKATSPIAKGAYKAITKGKDLGKYSKYAEDAVKGASAMAAYATTREGLDEALNPEEATFKERAKDVGIETALGFVGDPAVRLVGAGIKAGFNKGAEKVMSRFGKNQESKLLPNDAQPIEQIAKEEVAATNQAEAIQPNMQPVEEISPVLKNEPEMIARAEVENIQPQPVKTEPNQPMRLPEGVQAMASDTIPLRQPTGNKQFKDMTFWESAVNKVKKATGSKDVYEKPITRRELVGNMRKNLGVTIRTGRLNASEEVKGYFKVDPEVIRTRQHGDIQVISHEIGHALDKQFKLTNEAFDDELMKFGANTSGADYTPEQVREEGLAEFIRLFLTDPNKAVSEAPNFSQHFDTALPKKVKNGLLKTQNDVDTWIEQGPFFRSRGKIDFTGKEQESMGEKVDKIYTQFIDKFDRLAKVEKEITGQINDASKSIYKKARLAAGAPKKAEMVLQNLKETLEPISKHGYTMKDVSQYIADVHALELENMGQKIATEAAEDFISITQSYKESQDVSGLFKSLTEFQKQYDIDLEDAQLDAIRAGKDIELNEDQLYKIAQENRIESGKTLEEIQTSIQKLDSPEMQQVQQEIVGYNNMLLDMLRDGEVLSKEAVEAMREKYPNYVPFYRFFEDDITVGMSGNKGFTNLTSPVKRLKGSTRDVIDPLESIVKNTFAVVNAVEKNKVGLELSRLADIEGAGRFVERLDGAEQVKKENIVTVFENGEKVQYQLDKDLYEAVQQLDEDQANKVIQFLSYPTAALRAGATLTPEFMLRNPIRDQFQAFVVSNNGYKPILDLPLGVWEVIKGKNFKKDTYYKQWVMNGGGYGNYLSQDRNYLRETLKQMKKEGKAYQRGFRTITNPKEFGSLILRSLQSMSEFTEEATKLGEFRKAMKKGATPQEAAFQSRDLMDFARVGTDMKQWNRAVAFLNANLQGKDRIARAFKNNPVRSTVRALTAVTLPQIAAIAAMELTANEKQKETYENTPKWMKDTFFILPIPGTDELARIPKPFDLAPVFANPVSYIWDYIKDNDPETANEFLLSQGKELLKIPHMLTGLTPIIENITNYSFFTGGPIVPMRDQDLLPEDQYGVSTSLTARTVGKVMGSSPYKVDNLIRGYGAGLGKYATSGLDKVLEKAGAGTIPPQEAKKWSELPVINAFTVDSTGGGQVMTDFYESLDKLKVERNSAKRNEKTYERDDDYKLINKASRDISELRNEYRSVQGSYNLSPEQKRSQLDKLDQQMNQLAREALIRIGEKSR